MKRYKFLVPVLLVLIFSVSVYSKVSANAAVEREYESYLATARDFAGQGIELYAIENYKKALAVKPSLSLYLEVGELYQNLDTYKTAVSWGLQILDLYPEEIRAYEFMMNLYISQEDYAACFDLYDEASQHRLDSSLLLAVIDQIEYKYYLTGQYDDVSVYSENLCAVYDSKGWGYINRKGTKTISSQYIAAAAFSDGSAEIMDRDGDAYLVDSSGNKILVVEIGAPIEDIQPAYNGVYVFRTGAGWGLYKKDGSPVLEGIDQTSSAGNGVIAARKNGAWSIYDTEGNILLEQSFEDVIQDERNVAYRSGRLFVKKDGSYLMIDLEGNQYGEKYEDAVLFQDATYAAVQKDGKWGFVNTAGEWVIEPAYENARSFSNGYAAVCMNGKWGFINENNDLCIEYVFDQAKDFTTSGTVFVMQDHVWKLLCLYKNNH